MVQVLFLFKRTCCFSKYEAYFCATTPYLTVCPKKLAARIPKARSVLTKTSSGRPLKTNTPAAPVPKVGEAMMTSSWWCSWRLYLRTPFPTVMTKAEADRLTLIRLLFLWPSSTQQTEFSILPKWLVIADLNPMFCSNFWTIQSDFADT